MKRQILIALAALALFLPAPTRAAERPNVAGNYELAGRVPNRIFKLSLTQDHARIHAVFFAADLNQPGAQPMGDGDGKIDSDGVVQFKFKDNLANQGTATLVRDKNLYRLDIRVTTITDPTPLHFYGVLTLKKAGDPD